MKIGNALIDLSIGPPNLEVIPLGVFFEKMSFMDGHPCDDGSSAVQ